MCYSYLLSLNSSNFSLISTIKCRGTKFEGGGDVPSLVPQLINIGIELFSLFPMIISRGTHAHRESYIPSESSRDVSIAKIKKGRSIFEGQGSVWRSWSN